MMEDRVDLAYSELNTLITKAARGAGLSWGMAEEAGWAAEWLARRGLPAAFWATEWLAQSIGGGLTPVGVGVSISDALPETGTAYPDNAIPDGIITPGYVLPFLHRVSSRFGRLEIATPSGFAAWIDPDGTVTFGPGWSAQSAGWWVRVARSSVGLLRPAVPASVIDCLEGLALQTTVPPSAVSRGQAGSESDDSD